MQQQRIPYGYCQCGCGELAPISPNNHTANGYVKGEPRRYRVGHRAKAQPGPVERFWANVEKTDGCWNWTGQLDRDGYGKMFDGRAVRAHRFSYELLVGPIPDGLTIDHLCFNTRCVNPAHLEPVTVGENTRRARLRQMREGLSARTQRKIARWERIAELRRDAATVLEIAAALQTTKTAIDNAIADMRKAGWELPSRREVEAQRREIAGMLLRGRR